VVTTLDEDTVAIVDVLTAASLVVGFVDGTEVTFGVVIVAALVVGFVDGTEVTTQKLFSNQHCNEE
jgi:hypothetical protein